MKKLTAMMLVGCMSAGLLAGCGGSGNGDSQADSSDNAADNSVAADGTEAAGDESTGDASGSSAPNWKPYDELIANIKASTDTVEREKLMHQAEDMLMETNAVVPLYYYNDPWMMKSGMDVLTFSATNTLCT